MKIEATEIPDCYLIHAFQQQDQRGGFVKTYHEQIFDNVAFDFKIREAYYTWSEPNVFRGFHFQLPPKDHAKIVFCNVGMVTDYVVDLRKKSEAYGKVYAFQLNEDNRMAILIPRGCAHGFYVPSKKSMLTYMVETCYSPNHDTGILWSSLDYEFDFNNPVTSERDTGFPAIDEFKSPF